MKKTLLAVLFFVCFGASAGRFSAQVNTQTVAMSEVFQLTLSTSDGGNQSPDLSVLEKDFRIVGVSTSMSTRITNTGISKQKSWIVTLSPKRTGTLTIPAIALGNDSSQALTISAIKAEQLANQNDDAISLSATLDAGTHYIFQSIPLTLRIETRVPLGRAELITPQVEGLEITQRGEDKTSQLSRGGRPVYVIERHFNVRAQKTGKFTLPPFILRGHFRGRDAMSPFGFDSFFDSPFPTPFDSPFTQRGEPFVTKTQAIDLTVAANPNGKNEWFLPAKAVELYSAWQPNASQGRPSPQNASQQPHFKAGVATMRQVVLLALGAQPEQLPKLTFPAVKGVKIYTDSDVTDQIDTPDGLVARRIVTQSIVPEYGGEWALPAVKVKWQNTQTNKAEVATLASEKIVVMGEPAPEVKQQLLKPQSTGNAAKNTATTQPNQPDQSAQPLAETSVKTAWWWGGVAGFAALLLAVVYASYRFARRQRAGLGAASVASTAERKPANNDLKSAIKSAMSAQDAQRLYTALLAWKQAHKNSNLTPAFQQLLAQVESSLYQTGEPLDFVALQSGLDQALTSPTNEGKKGDELPDLYR